MYACMYYGTYICSIKIAQDHFPLRITFILFSLLELNLFLCDFVTKIFASVNFAVQKFSPQQVRHPEICFTKISWSSHRA